MGCRPSKQATSKVRALEQCLCSPKKQQNKKHKCSSASASDFRSDGYRPSASSGTRPLSSASADAATLINAEFPAFSTTSAVYRRSAAKTSKITLRLSCDGSTLEIEQCDYDFEKTSPEPSLKPRPWSSTPNLSLNHPSRRRPNSWLMQDQYLPLRHSASGWSSKLSKAARSSGIPNSHSKAVSRRPSSRSSSEATSRKGLVQYPDVTTRTVVVEQHACPGATSQSQKSANTRGPMTKTSASMPSISPLAAASNEHRSFQPSAVMEQMSSQNPRRKYTRQSSMPSTAYNYMANSRDGSIGTHDSRNQFSRGSASQEFRRSIRQSPEDETTYITFKSIPSGSSSQKQSNRRENGFAGSKNSKAQEVCDEVEVAGWVDPRGVSRTMSFSEHLKFVSKQVEKAWQDSEKSGGLRDRYRHSARERRSEYCEINDAEMMQRTRRHITTTDHLGNRGDGLRYEMDAITPTESDSVMTFINLGCPVYGNNQVESSYNEYKVDCNGHMKTSVINKSYKHSSTEHFDVDSINDETSRSRKHSNNIRKRKEESYASQNRKEENSPENIIITVVAQQGFQDGKPSNKVRNEQSDFLAASNEQIAATSAPDNPIEGINEKEIRERLTNTFLQSEPEVLLDTLPCSTIDTSGSSNSDNTPQWFDQVCPESPGEILQCPDYLAVQFKSSGEGSSGSEMTDSSITVPNESSLSNSSGELINCCLVTSSSTDGDTRAASQSNSSSISFESATYVTEDTFGTADSSTDVDTTLVDASVADNVLDNDSDRDEWHSAKSKHYSDSSTEAKSSKQQDSAEMGKIRTDSTGYSIKVADLVLGNPSSNDFEIRYGHHNPTNDRSINVQTSESQHSEALKEYGINSQKCNDRADSSNSDSLQSQNEERHSSERKQTDSEPSGSYMDSETYLKDLDDLGKEIRLSVSEETNNVFVDPFQMLEAIRRIIVDTNIESMVANGEPGYGFRNYNESICVEKSARPKSKTYSTYPDDKSDMSASNRHKLRGDIFGDEMGQDLQMEIDNEALWSPLLLNSKSFTRFNFIELTGNMAATEGSHLNLAGNLAELDSLRSNILAVNLAETGKTSLFDQLPTREMGHLLQDSGVTIKSAILAKNANCERHCVSQSNTCPHVGPNGIPTPTHPPNPPPIDNTTSACPASKEADDAFGDNEKEKTLGDSDELHFTEPCIDHDSGSGPTPLHSSPPPSPCRILRSSPTPRPRSPLSSSPCLSQGGSRNDRTLNPKPLSPSASQAESTKIRETEVINEENISSYDLIEEGFINEENLSKRQISADTGVNFINNDSSIVSRADDKSQNDGGKAIGSRRDNQTNSFEATIDENVSTSNTTHTNVENRSIISSAVDKIDSLSIPKQVPSQIESSSKEAKPIQNENMNSHIDSFRNETLLLSQSSYEKDFNPILTRKENPILSNSAPQQGSKKSPYTLSQTNKLASSEKPEDSKGLPSSDRINVNCDTAMHKVHKITEANQKESSWQLDIEKNGDAYSHGKQSGDLSDNKTGAHINVKQSVLYCNQSDASDDKNGSLENANQSSLFQNQPGNLSVNQNHVLADANSAKPISFQNQSVSAKQSTKDNTTANQSATLIKPKDYNKNKNGDLKNEIQTNSVHSQTGPRFENINGNLTSAAPSALLHNQSDVRMFSSRPCRSQDVDKNSGARQKSTGPLRDSGHITAPMEAEGEQSKRRRKKNKVLSLVKYFERSHVSLDAPKNKRKV